MPSSHLSTRPNRPLLSAALALAGWVGVSAAASGQQILEVHGPTLEVNKYTSGTNSQGVRPTVQQRGVNLDGSMRAGSVQGWALAGNASDPGGSVGQTRLGEVSLATGTYAPFEVDLALPAPGMGRWVIGRSHSHTQKTSTPAHLNSNGPQGYNWFQTSQPEIVVYGEKFNPENDVVYIVYGADRFTEATADPLDALHADLKGASRAFVFGLSTTIHDKPGARVDESRSYFTVPTTGLGTAGTNFDATTFAYDDMGRRIRSEGPDGTISRTAYDDLGRAWRSYIGTNDNGEAGGDTSGTNNMVKVSETTFDGGSSGGNSLVTARTSYVEDSTTDQRVTSFQHDVRGRTIVTENPQAPHSLVKYDNLGRMVASATYSSASGLDPSDDPTSLATNRLSLSQTFYDEAGRVYKTQRHLIDASDGSDDDHLATLTWYDRSGRVIKVRGEGVHTKTRYDRLGRAVRRFTLAKDDDASNTYSDVYDTSAHSTKVDGDHVLVEDQTYFRDSTGNALMQVRISRHHNDSSTTGELDTDSDLSLVDASELEGRAQINCMFYDTLDRVTHTVAVGTFGGSDFDRDNVAHANTTPSATNLVSQTVYNDNGTVWKSIDPRSKEARFEYDDAGRRRTMIANYVNEVPSGPTGDDDVHTRFEYTNGHQTKMWVDLDGDKIVDSDDQVTEYVYGVTKGGSFPDSKIAHGGLLARVIYPPNDSGGTQAAADRDVWFAYNAQGQELWRQDQTELEIQLDYDTAGRLTHRRVIDMDTAGDLDDTVRRISYTYTPRGQTETITQWDEHDPASGTDSELDQVKYTYDDWGNITQIEQDHNGVVGDIASLDDYEVRYTYQVQAPSNARSMIRRTLQEIVYVSTSKNGVEYTYGTTDSINDLAGRVFRLEIASTPIARYSYNGETELLATELVPTACGWTLDSIITPQTYPNLDRFNRITANQWSKGDDDYFYDVRITYDEASNITRVIDNVHIDPGAGGSGPGTHAFDAAYSIDGLNRVTRAHEGKWDTSSITTEYRDEQWILTQTGNWDRNKVDLNGNGNFTDAGELDDTRTHSPVNEILSRDLDSNPGTTGNNYDLSNSYNLRGDLEDDKQQYKYVWDAFGRLVEIRRQNSSLVAAYRYNGLNQRITWHYDATGNGTTDGSDPTYHFAYDEKWRIVGTWRDTDANLKEMFIYHNAGLAGRGGSSYIDTVVLRDRDMTNGWTGAADGTQEERHYYLQNWRGDVSAIFDHVGALVEWQKYSAYGVPYLITPGDHNKDGVVDSNDYKSFDEDYDAGNLRADLNKDGVLTTADQTLFNDSYTNPVPGGRWRLSSEDVGNRKGYAGYEHEGFGNDLAAPEIAHVRNRVFHFGLGRWTRRDPLGYVDGVNTLAAYRTNPVGFTDWNGYCSTCVGSASPPPPSIVWPAPPASPSPIELLPNNPYLPPEVPATPGAPVEPARPGGVLRTCWRTCASGLGAVWECCGTVVGGTIIGVACVLTLASECQAPAPSYPGPTYTPPAGPPNYPPVDPEPDRPTDSPCMTLWKAARRECGRCRPCSHDVLDCEGYVLGELCWLNCMNAIGNYRYARCPGSPYPPYDENSAWAEGDYCRFLHASRCTDMPGEASQ